MQTTLARCLLLLCFVSFQVDLFDTREAVAQSQVSGSFVYGGQSSKVLLQSWAKSETTSVSAAGRQVTETTWREPNGGLVATWHVEKLADSSALEYRWIFENQGTQATKAITDVAALDLTLADASPNTTRQKHGGAGRAIGLCNIDVDPFAGHDSFRGYRTILEQGLAIVGTPRQSYE